MSSLASYASLWNKSSYKKKSEWKNLHNKSNLVLVYILKQMEICREKKDILNLEQINKSKVNHERVFHNFLSKTDEVLALFYLGVIPIFWLTQWCESRGRPRLLFCCCFLNRLAATLKLCDAEQRVAVCPCAVSGQQGLQAARAGRRPPPAPGGFQLPPTTAGSPWPPARHVWEVQQ